MQPLKEKLSQVNIQTVNVPEITKETTGYSIKKYQRILQTADLYKAAAHMSFGAKVVDIQGNNVTKKHFFRLKTNIFVVWYVNNIKRVSWLKLRRHRRYLKKLTYMLKENPNKVEKLLRANRFEYDAKRKKLVNSQAKQKSNNNLTANEVKPAKPVEKTQAQNSKVEVAKQEITLQDKENRLIQKVTTKVIPKFYYQYGLKTQGGQVNYLQNFISKYASGSGKEKSIKVVEIIKDLSKTEFDNAVNNCSKELRDKYISKARNWN